MTALPSGLAPCLSFFRAIGWIWCYRPIKFHEQQCCDSSNTPSGTNISIVGLLVLLMCCFQLFFFCRNVFSFKKTKRRPHVVFWSFEMIFAIIQGLKSGAFSAWMLDNPFSSTQLVEPLSTILSVISCFCPICIVKSLKAIQYFHFCL